MRIKPDVIVTWPKNNDYPLWRKFITDNRSRFNEVFIVFMETNQGDDYRSFVKSAMGEDLFTFIESPKINSGEDWRNVAVCEALKHSKAEWVWFTEQDFFVTNEIFWTDIDEALDYDANVIGVLEGDRIHPCSLFVPRQLINSTHFDFGADPGNYDHFARFTNDLVNMNAKMIMISDDLYNHYNGLSHNWSLASQLQLPNYRPDQFLDYLLMCLNNEIELDTRFKRIADRTISKLMPKQG